jgi:alpha-D-ribose 1-methylphosphonate 5-triphosphate synthase subunit PhnL
MLLQDVYKTEILSTEKDEQLKNLENINDKINNGKCLVMSTDEVSESKLDLFLDSNRRKFESEIGRDIVHERRMRKELMDNSSSTGK